MGYERIAIAKSVVLSSRLLCPPRKAVRCEPFPIFFAILPNFTKIKTAVHIWIRIPRSAGEHQEHGGQECIVVRFGIGLRDRRECEGHRFHLSGKVNNNLKRIRNERYYPQLAFRTGTRISTFVREKRAATKTCDALRLFLALFYADFHALFYQLRYQCLARYYSENGTNGPLAPHRTSLKLDTAKRTPTSRA